VEVNPFTSERLGGGLRSTRYWSTADDQLMVTVRYGWRVDEAGIDLCFYMVWSDPGHMAAYADAVDDFARSLWISDARQKGGNSAGHAPLVRVCRVIRYGERSGLADTVHTVVPPVPSGRTCLEAPPLCPLQPC
jgi:hypothetical protein